MTDDRGWRARKLREELRGARAAIKTLIYVIVGLVAFFALLWIGRT